MEKYLNEKDLVVHSNNLLRSKINAVNALNLSYVNQIISPVHFVYKRTFGLQGFDFKLSTEPLGNISQKLKKGRAVC